MLSIKVNNLRYNESPEFEYAEGSTHLLTFPESLTWATGCVVHPVSPFVTHLSHLTSHPDACGTLQLFMPHLLPGFPTPDSFHLHFVQAL